MTERFFDDLKNGLQKFGGAVIQHGPGIIKSIAPVALELLKNRARGARESGLLLPINKSQIPIRSISSVADRRASRLDLVSDVPVPKTTLAAGSNTKDEADDSPLLKRSHRSSESNDRNLDGLAWGPAPS